MKTRKGSLSAKELAVIGITITAIALMIAVIQGGVDTVLSETLEKLL